MAADRVIVVGAGVAGLSAAAVLAARGCAVTVLERHAAVGGKVRQARANGRTIDVGPTVLTLRPVLEELFATAGARLDDHLRLTRAEVLARHLWSGGVGLDLFADAQRSAQAVGEFAGAGEAAAFRAFADDARHAFQTLHRPFMRRPSPSLLGLLLRAGPAALSRIDPYASLGAHLHRRFADPRLRQLFGRYATYVGAAPATAPATLMLVADVEAQGVWLVEGGMARLAQALADVARGHGATIHVDTPVAEIETRRGRACGVRLADGQRLAAGAVICATDLATLQAGALGERPAAGLGRPPRAGRRSLSAVTWAGVARIEGPAPSRHTVLFSDDSATEFADLAAGRMPHDPTVYLCAQDRGAAAVEPFAPVEPERLFILVNAPARGDDPSFFPLEAEACRARTMRRLERCGLTLAPSEPMQATTPKDFARLFPGTGGALYGPPTRGWTSAFRRPGVRSPTAGLYLAGGGAHPGPGVPMAALSGLMCAQEVLTGLTSRARSGRTATPGGTSTPSARTAAAA